MSSATENFDRIISTVTIAASGTTSGATGCPAGYALVRLETPASWDGGNIKLTESNTEGGTYLTIATAGDASTASADMVINTPGASKSFPIVPTLLVGVKGFIKVTCASAVSADRVITLVFSKTSL